MCNRDDTANANEPKSLLETKRHHRRYPLHAQINLFREEESDAHGIDDFCKAMQDIQELGNRAAHQGLNDSQDATACDDAVSTMQGVALAYSHHVASLTQNPMTKKKRT